MILDLYAGAGGWDEGARQLGLDTVGLEIWHDACVTAVRAGHPRIRCDITKYPTCAFTNVTGLIGSPPCTTFSPAGNGAGRQVVEILVRALSELAAGRATRAARRKECQRAIAAWALTKRPKMRRAERAAWAWEQAKSAVQVLEPLRFARDLRPEWIALEQVEAVLPLWRHIAHILRGWGYDAWTGVLNSADYGVPQTRKRAVLIASRVRRVCKPVATHEQNPPADALFGALRPWVSMAEALGWDDTVEVVSNYSTHGDPNNRGVRTGGQPAATVTSKASRTKLVSRRDSPKWVAEHGERRNREGDEPAPTITGEAHRWKLVNGAQDNATARGMDEPAGTIYCSRPGNLRWAVDLRTRSKGADGSMYPTPTVSDDRPAPTLTSKAGGQWVFRRPATTVQGDPRIGRPGHKDRAGGEAQFAEDSLRVTVSQAAILQSFPADYPWHGNKTSQFLQVGNAVPPGLSAAVIAVAAGVPAAAGVAS